MIVTTDKKNYEFRRFSQLTFGSIFFPIEDTGSLELNLTPHIKVRAVDESKFNAVDITFGSPRVFEDNQIVCEVTAELVIK